MAERCCCWSLKVEGRIGIELVLCFHPVPEVQYICISKQILRGNVWGNNFMMQRRQKDLR